jgi:hypothetical protein
MTMVEGIGIALTGVGMLGGLVAWSMKMTVAPLRVVIENNTKAMERIINKIDEHDEKLDDHGVRLSIIETKHEANHGGGK